MIYNADCTNLCVFLSMSGKKVNSLVGLPDRLTTARKRSLGQGNIFTPVCHSVHRGGSTPPGQVHPPGPGTPPGQVHPPRDQVHTPLGPGTSPRDRVHPPGPGTPPWDQVHTPLGPGTPPGVNSNFFKFKFFKIQTF